MKVKDLIEIMPYKNVIVIQTKRGKVLEIDDIYTIIHKDGYKENIANLEVWSVEVEKFEDDSYLKISTNSL